MKQVCEEKYLSSPPDTINSPNVTNQSTLNLETTSFRRNVEEDAADEFKFNEDQTVSLEQLHFENELDSFSYPSSWKQGTIPVFPFGNVFVYLQAMMIIIGREGGRGITKENSKCTIYKRPFNLILFFLKLRSINSWEKLVDKLGNGNYGKLKGFFKELYIMGVSTERDKKTSFISSIFTQIRWFYRTFFFNFNKSSSSRVFQNENNSAIVLGTWEKISHFLKH